MSVVNIANSDDQFRHCFDYASVRPSSWNNSAPTDGLLGYLILSSSRMAVWNIQV